MVADALNGVYRKIERADKHIDDLYAEVANFLGARPYAIGIKHDAESGDYSHCLVVCAEIPDVIPLVIGDAISCLRSALDQLAYRIWGACGGHGRERNVYFPIFDDRSKYEAGFTGRIEGATPKVRRAFDAVEPYKGGNGHDLWVIQSLNNTDKHRLLISAGNAFQQLSLSGDLHPDGFGIYIDPRERSFPLVLGDIFCHTDKEVDLQNQVAFQIAFNEPGVIERKSVLESLPHLANVVRNVVRQLAGLL